MARPTHLLPAVAALCLTSAVLVRANATQTTQGTSTGQVFPEGPGREVAMRICQDCHPAGDIVKHRESRFRWSVIVEQMIGEGASIRDEEFEVIVTYLSVALGKKVRINEASATVIAETFDISEDLAAAIVKHRTERGPFKDWKDVAAAPGVDPKRIEEQKGNLDFGK